MCPHAQRHLATWIILHFWSYMNEWCLPVHNRGLVTTTINIFNSLNVRNLFRITGSLGLGSLSTGWTVRGSNPGGGEIFRACPDRSWGPPSLLYNGYRVFPGGKERSGRDADPSPPSSAVIKKEESYTTTPPMGRTACTEPQCLYKGALYLFFTYWISYTSSIIWRSEQYTCSRPDLLRPPVSWWGGTYCTAMSQTGGAGVCRQIITVLRNSSNGPVAITEITNDPVGRVAQSV